MGVLQPIDLNRQYFQRIGLRTRDSCAWITLCTTFIKPGSVYDYLRSSKISRKVIFILSLTLSAHTTTQSAAWFML